MSTGLVYDEIYLEHRTEPHPEQPMRLMATMAHLERVGLPDWGEYVELLAAACERHDAALDAQVIRQRLEDGRHAAAVSAFKSSTRIPHDERWKELAAPFREVPPPERIERLTPLVGLGFAAVLTTNYDRSLHHAYAQGSGYACIPLEVSIPRQSRGL